LVNNKLTNICVFCGSRDGTNANYVTLAKKLGEEIAARKYSLVYGGGNHGMMGAVAEAVQTNGGSVLGVIPRALAPKEISGVTVGEVIYVDDMHTRKKIMYEKADAFIALPGGIGTFEELFEALTWIQLGIHSKPVGVLNIDGYYTHLEALLRNSAEKGFVNESFVNRIIFSDNVDDLLRRLETSEAPAATHKWITSNQA
ncbi:hypothetical protein SAMD00019534_064800, partial [Acytostelium subglobosum LB1]|uniref:hypothetical protein n=1 Tax=Acytostelium subglobosum LB1 TaxID=1410327 RepID=UPI000644E145